MPYTFVTGSKLAMRSMEMLTGYCGPPWLDWVTAMFRQTSVSTLLQHTCLLFSSAVVFNPGPGDPLLYTFLFYLTHSAEFMEFLPNELMI